MRDSEGTIIYIGKAKHLRNRLRSYFHTRHTRKRLIQLVSEIASIEVMIVNNEAESLILENNLIKIHKPAYNRALKKDNSGYAYLQMTDEPLPRIDVLYRDRREPADRPADARTTGSPYGDNPHRFGPYYSSRFRNAVLAFITDHYRLRSCTTLPKRACLLYHIHKCSGVCEGHISPEAYRDTARQATQLLTSKDGQLLEAMREKMAEYAERMEYERAGNMLTHIRILEQLPAKQIVDRELGTIQEVLYFGKREVLIARVQEGMLRSFALHPYAGSAGEYAPDLFLLSHYRESGPDELIVSQAADAAAVQSALRRSGRKGIRVTVPRRGLKAELLKLCEQNYRYRCESGKTVTHVQSASDSV
ncbi:GIY-YIG nuclease family protein [Paenibacillus sp. 1P07SE]|uniref:GIY-YIG nuclease family protein n=1 Tax=Paenibacillus sp. 1P07SE TaxID=3132209 RepID=UPI0039A43FC6